MFEDPADKLHFSQFVNLNHDVFDVDVAVVEVMQHNRFREQLLS